MALLRVGDLPEEALAAAARFHAEALPRIEAALASIGAGDHFALAFAPADHTHHGWRLAAVQQLARVRAPIRVNGLESEDETAIAAALAYLATAPGVTGQLLRLDAAGAGGVASSVP